MDRYREIVGADVGRRFFRAFGRTWQVQDFIGRILEQDVGKRVFLRGGVLQVENNEQRAARAGKAKVCPGCGRLGRECWNSPCLYLEFVLARPLGELKAWCETVGGTFVSRKDEPGAHPEGR